MLLPTAALLLAVLPGCSIYCRDKGELEISVFDSDGGYVDVAEVEVELTSPSGAAVEVEEEDWGWYARELKPGDYTVTATACDGDQVVEVDIEVTPTNRCQDKAEVTSVDVDLDPC